MLRKLASLPYSQPRGFHVRRSTPIVAAGVALLALGACAPEVTSSDGDIGREGVDLEITHLRVSSDPIQTFALSVEVDLSANITYADADVRIWLSPPQQPYLESLLIDSRRVAVASNASFTTRVRTETLGWPLGPYIVNCRADLAGTWTESDPANNTASWPQWVTAGTPSKSDLGIDLGAATTVASTSLIGPGALVQISGRIANAGDGFSGPFRVGVYASTDTTITTSDTLLGYVNFTDLSPGTSAPFQASLNTTSLGANSAYEIGWIADPDRVTNDPDTSDNAHRATNGPVSIGFTARADLTTTSDDATASVSSITGPGATFSVAFPVRNRGNASSTSCSASVYASLDASVTAGDFLLGTVPVPGLSSNAAATVTLASANTASLSTGQQYYVGWIVDPTNVVIEHSDSNNAAQLLTRIAVGATPGRPDLATQVAGSSLDPTVILASGLPIRVACEVRNLGSATSQECVVHFYASTDATITTSDFLLGARSVAPLSGGEVAVCTLDVASTAHLASSASYFVGWIVDPFGTVPESSKANNRAVALSQLSINGAAQALTNGLTVPFNVQPNGVVAFRIAPSSPASDLSVTITGYGDADLYVQRAPIAWPGEQGRHDTPNFKARYLAGSSESVTFPGPAEGAWWILVHGYDSTGPSTGSIRANWASASSTAWVRETPHPYSNNASYTFTYSAPGALLVGVHFDRLATELDYDVLYVRNQQGSIVHSVSGDLIAGGQSTGGNVFGRTDGWCYVTGSSVTIELVTDTIVTAYGFRTDLAYASY